MISGGKLGWKKSEMEDYRTFENFCLKLLLCVILLVFHPFFMKNLPVSNPYFCNLYPFEELATVLKVFLAYTLILAQYVNEAEIC